MEDMKSKQIEGGCMFTNIGNAIINHQEDFCNDDQLEANTTKDLAELCVCNNDHVVGTL